MNETKAQQKKRKAKEYNNRYEEERKLEKQAINRIVETIKKGDKDEIDDKTKEEIIRRLYD